MTLWIDAHLSPLIAAWLTWTFADVQAVPLRDLGLRDAEDEKFSRPPKSPGPSCSRKMPTFGNYSTVSARRRRLSGSLVATRPTSGCKKYFWPPCPPR